MNLAVHPTPDSFLSTMQEVLERHEAFHNLMLGMALRVLRAPERFRQQPFFATVSDEAAPVAAALMTPPNNLILYSEREAAAPAISLIAAEIHRQGRRVPGVVGPPRAASLFAEAWTRLTGLPGRRAISHGLFELRQVDPPAGPPGANITFAHGRAGTMEDRPPGANITPFASPLGTRGQAFAHPTPQGPLRGAAGRGRLPPNSPEGGSEGGAGTTDRSPVGMDATRRPPGWLRAARVEEAALLAGWACDFQQEALSHAADPDEMRAILDLRIGDGDVFVWEDDAPVSMAIRTRPTRTGISIGSVYTPPGLRGRGYASACVAALSQLCLDSGREFCMLYTDLSNPTSNRIYQKIGYRAIGESSEYRFGESHP